MATQTLNLLPSASGIDPLYVLPASNDGKTYKVSLLALYDWISSRDVVSHDTNYTMSYTDGRATINYNGNGSSSLVVPNHNDEPILIGTSINVTNNTLIGSLNIIPSSGVSINSALGTYVKNHGISLLTKVDTNSWILSGDLNLYEDTYFDKTKLLLKLDQNITDNSLWPKNISNNNVQIVTSNSRFNDGSAQFSNGAYLSIPSSSDFDFGTGDFTIESWAYLNGHGGNGYNHFFSINQQDTFALKSYSGNYYLYANSTTAVSTTITPILNSWHHIALVRYGQRLFLFINGELKGESIISPTITYGSASEARIGLANGTSGEYLDGLLNDIRVTKGQARYITNFTPPSQHLYNNKNIKTPDMVAGLQLWLDASDSTTLYDATTGGSLSGSDGSVLRWVDKSINNYSAIQPDLNTAPVRKLSTLNNKDTLYFSGNKYLNISNIGVSQCLTAIIVWKPEVNTAYAFDSVSSSDGILDRVTFLNSSGFYAYAGTDNFRTNNNILTNNWTICSVVFDRTSSKGYINSTLILNGNAGNNNMTSLRIGSRYSLSDYLTGHIGEILIYDSAMTDDGRILVENYLREKWGF